MSNSSIWPIDRTLSDATPPGKSEPGSDDNEGIPNIFQSSRTEEASPWFNVIPRALVGGGVYPSAEIQLVYSTASAK